MKRPPPSAARRAALPALAALLLALGGCSEPGPAGGFLLPFPAAAGAAPSEDDYEARGIRFSHAPAAGELVVDDQRRPVLLTTAAGWTWRGRVPEGARLFAGAQATDGAWQAARELTVRVGVRGGGEERELAASTLAAGERDRWLDLSADLAGLAGEVVTLEFSADLAGAPDDARSERWIAWGPVALHGAAAAAGGGGERPNVVLIVVDTLRADHLGAYGHPLPTSPEIDRRLAARGTLFEDAYAQAPWTLPSVLSFLTGRPPGELLPAGREAPTAVPPGVPTIAERLRDAGYRTAAFVANPTLQPTVGFDRGFETWWAPPAEVESLRLDAAEVNRRALPWLAAHAGAPFFLYLHYMDPHDPYAPPETGAAEAPFFPGYEGEVTGEMVQGLYLGEVELADPEADRRQLAALYDGEIAHVDGRIGEVLAAFDERLAADTLFVLTADHGEELGDHGGWKHGHTLYDEQIRVPLIARWDGRVRAGRRIEGAVRLLDLVPTLLTAAGLGRPPGLAGADLTPVLTGIEPLPRRVALSRHLSFGPLRAAAVLDDWKLILFNRREPFEPENDLHAATAPFDLERLERIELYDLSADPGETRDLSTEAIDRVEQLAPAIHAQLDRELPGLKVMLDRAPAGSRVTGRLTLAAAPAGWLPYFLAEGDEVTVDGREIAFAWTAEVLSKGIRVLGEVGGVESLAVAIDGEPAAGGRVLLGRGVPYAGGPVPPARLVAESWPFAVSASTPPVLRVWRRAPAPDAVPPPAPDDAGAAAAAEEERQRLRALG
ncbi:MAG TPA: sulfatase, partial [Thermoanaerobaculia bacterium]|nr:sulfatase [Thermoanaerobaculia bacterium]